MFQINSKTKITSVTDGTSNTLLDGEPLPRAEVTFLPMVPGFGAEIMSTAVTDDNGRFRLTCGDKPGACACEHKVTVAEGPLPDELRGMSPAAQAGAARELAGRKNRPIPDRYGNFAQTPLTVTVTQGQKDYQIKLMR